MRWAGGGTSQAEVFGTGVLGAVPAPTVRAVIEHLALTAPERPFLLDAGEASVTTFAMLRGRVAGLARAVAARGVAAGESVAYAMGNGPRAAEAILALMYGGYRATAINLVSGPATIAHVMEHSGCRLIVADDDQRGLLEAALGERVRGMDIVSAEQLARSVVAPRGAAASATGEGPGPAPTPGDDALLMYTSGTTGLPKGVLLSHANVLAGGANVVAAHQLTRDDRALCILPLYHINGLCVTIMGPLVSGGSVVLPKRFSASGFWGQLTTGECTWFSAVPTQLSYLLHGEEPDERSRSGLARVRFARSASAPLAPEVQSAFEARFSIPIIETMGLTETAAQILSNPLPPGVRKIGSPGIAYGNEVTIGDGEQREVARGAEGEVLVRGCNVMRGYYRNRQETEKALTADGWLRTGDLGRMDADGYVTITGRLKELIIKGGENIAPREIDEALYGHPDVIEAAAFARPCPTYGQRVEACVAVREASVVDEAGLIALCAARVGAFKAPDRVHFLAELPKGPSGKIQRLKLAGIVDEK
ncbi:MAG: AMP-binding protein [Rhizobiales bacterium]|nr:AMP-binding protein [Hyphomicrobiales bacterium]